MFLFFTSPAATVASQWLELIQQDIQGRLSGNDQSVKSLVDLVEVEQILTSIIFCNCSTATQQEESSKCNKYRFALIAIERVFIR